MIEPKVTEDTPDSERPNPHTSIEVPIVIDAGDPPPVAYVNALQVQVAPRELFLTWGCAPPPTGNLANIAAVHAEYVARLVLSPSLLDDLVRQLVQAREAYRSLQAILAASEAGAGSKEEQA